MRISLWAAALAVLQGVQSLPQITRTGKYLYDPSGNRFSIKVSAAWIGGEWVVRDITS
jgi:hypothetical protein